MNLHLIQPVIAWARPHRAALAAGMALMTLESLAALALPWLGGQFAGVVWPAGQTPGAAQGWSVATLVALMIAAAAAQAALQFGSGYLLTATGERIVADLKGRVYDHLQALPMGYFHARRLGDSLALVTRDVEQVSSYITHTLVSIAPLLLTVLGAALLMFGIQPWLAALCVVLVPVFVILLRLFGRKLRPLSVALSEEYAASYALFEENLSMLPAIKTFTREPQESQRVQAQVQRIRQLAQREAFINAGLGPMVQLLALSGLLVLLGVAAAQLGSGRLQAAEVVSFLLYAHLLTRPVPLLANVYGQTQLTRAALGRIVHALQQGAEPAGGTPAAPAAPVAPAAPAAQAAPPLRGEIAFEEVHFTYPGREPVLQGLNLHIGAGQTIAIVGPNGSGKSTLTHLLLRLIEPDAGTVRLDGHDIAALPLRGLRQQIGIVPQLPLLFHASVYDNIAYGNPQASAQQVHQAARLACAHEFIEHLPQRYETLIGDRGVRLSGGQQQRVALARALLKNPAILILDEATSMFDPDAEAEFLTIVHQALRGKTVLLITHRPASLALADRVVRMSDGRCLEVTAGGATATQARNRTIS
jgi:subfamily B ATP-binding cassette protein MsbA